MSSIELNNKIASLQEWEALQAEAAAMVESIKDEIKAHMDRIGVEELQAGTHIVRWTTTLTTRFDSTAFKKVIQKTRCFQELSQETLPKRLPPLA